jgi:hypothetical protein
MDVAAGAGVNVGMGAGDGDADAAGFGLGQIACVRHIMPRSSTAPPTASHVDASRCGHPMSPHARTGDGGIEMSSAQTQIAANNRNLNGMRTSVLSKQTIRVTILR